MRDKKFIIDKIQFVIEKVLELRGVDVHEHTRFKRDYWFTNFDLIELFVNLDLILQIELPLETMEQLIVDDSDILRIIDALKNAPAAPPGPPCEWKLKLAKDFENYRWSRRSKK